MRDRHREVEKHEWSQREYGENQLRDLSNRVHEMATMVKGTPISSDCTRNTRSQDPL